MWIRQYVTVFFLGQLLCSLGLFTTLQPDLTLPDLGSEGGMESNLEGQKDAFLPPVPSKANSGASDKA